MAEPQQCRGRQAWHTARGEYQNAGSDCRAAGCPDPVKVHDVDKNLGKVAPYGIYDVATNAAWVSLGIGHDTAEFAVNAVRRASSGWFCPLSEGGSTADHRRWRWPKRIAETRDSACADKPASVATKPEVQRSPVCPGPSGLARTPPASPTHSPASPRRPADSEPAIGRRPRRLPLR